MSKIQNPTKVITEVNTRWSYANVWNSKSINGGAPKYSVSLIIPKSDTVTVNKIITTRKTGGLLTGYKPVVLGQRLKALAFTTFKPHSH